MKNKRFVATTDEVREKKKLDKLADRLFNVSEITKIMTEILTDYVEQVSSMEEKHIKYDRSKWMLDHGIEKEYERYDGYEADLHTIAILIEQIRRYGKIIYDDKANNVRLD